MIKKYSEFQRLINNYFKLPTNDYNYKSVLKMSNVLQIKEQYYINLKAIEYKPI